MGLLSVYLDKISLVMLIFMKVILKLLFMTYGPIKINIRLVDNKIWWEKVKSWNRVMKKFGKSGKNIFSVGQQYMILRYRKILSFNIKSYRLYKFCF